MLENILAGMVVSSGLQVTKGNWNRFLMVGIAVVTSALAGYQVNGQEGAAISTLSALATHAVLFENTKLGQVMKWALAPKTLRLVARILNKTADSVDKRD